MQTDVKKCLSFGSHCVMFKNRVGKLCIITFLENEICVHAGGKYRTLYVQCQGEIGWGGGGTERRFCRSLCLDDF